MNYSAAHPGTSLAGGSFINSATGSPVKVVRIVPEGKAQKISYQRFPGSVQSIISSSSAGSSGQTTGTVIIKDPKAMYKTGGGNQVQYVRVVQPQGTSIRPSLKPIAPYVSKAPLFSGHTFSHSRESIVEHHGVPPPTTAIIVKKKTVIGNRKPCNCTRSMCLKLYCECFANGEFCRNCNCKDCHNNLENEEERSKAIKTSLERNPNAFQPKIGKTGRSEVDRMHQKGCHCKKSSCLKNYCECYEAKVSCTIRCKCVGCRNTEQDRMSKGIPKFSSSTGLLHLANAASSLSADLVESESPTPSEPPIEQRDPKTMPWYYMTDEVVECTALCLVAQAEELERNGVADEGEIEKAILKGITITHKICLEYLS